MGFTTLAFVLIVPLIVIAYYICPDRMRPVFLLLISLLFGYSFLPGVLLPLCIISIVTYALGIIISSRTRNKLLIFITGIGIIVLLMIFSRLNYTFWPAIGVSYYSLQAISYLTDIYKGTLQAETNLIYFSLYISFFPRFLSGPIERAGDFLPQIREARKIPSYEMLKRASVIILWGYFEKLVVADHASMIVTEIFDTYQTQHGYILIVGAVLYAIQLYADFDGYSNIALGIAALFGFQITKNFRRPYFAVSISEFWHRWHISLSNWLRDYIYILLGGNRKGKIRQYLNLLITFGISGIWHGSGMKYLVWGMLHAFYQIMGKILKPCRNKIRNIFHITKNNFMIRIFQCLGVFILVDFAWVFFRASSLHEALGYLYYTVVNFIPDETVNYNIMRLNIDLSIYITLIWGIITLLTGDLIRGKCGNVISVLSKLNVIIRWGIYLFIVGLIMCSVLQRYGMDTSGFLYAQF